VNIHPVQAPNQDALLFKDRYETWESKHNCKVATGTRETFMDLFDDDDTLEYEPATTAALIFTGGDEDAEKAALEVSFLHLLQLACRAVHALAVSLMFGLRSGRMQAQDRNVPLQVCKEAEITVISKDSEEQKPTEYLAQQGGQI